MANIIDPNDGIAPQPLINLGLNAAPDYSEMFIFAELTAKRRGSSVIVTEGVGKISAIGTENDSININLMGFDPDTNQYTTRWTNSLDNTGETPFEGFGISQITFKMNASYVPEVEIQFVDIRGLSLITLGTKSKYSVLYSFPPPIFNLTLKGYYGKAANYSLHMLKQSTRFDANTGNYVITCSFVGQRFAALTDILFKYIDIVPLMDENINLETPEVTGVDLDLSSKPRNTRELITRAKKLYDSLDKLKTDSKDANDLNKIKEYSTQIQSVIDNLDNYSIIVGTKTDVSNNVGTYLFTLPNAHITTQGQQTNVNDSNIASKVRTVNVYANKLRLSSADGVNNAAQDDRIMILYEYDENLAVDQNKKDSINDTFTVLKNNFLNQAKTVDNTLAKNDGAIKYYGFNQLPPNKGKRYVGLDVTDFYTSLRKRIVAQEEDYTTKQTALRAKVNDLTVQKIGALPTIRNIFEVFANDIETFFQKLRSVCNDAEKAHQVNADMRRILENNNSKRKDTTKSIAAFPLVLNQKLVTDENGKTIKRRERAYPGDPNVGLDNMNFPEVDFVETFIETFTKLVKIQTNENMKESIDADGNNIWIPINPIDSSVGNRTTESPYNRLTNIPQIMNEVLNRFYVGSQYSYGFLFYQEDGAVAKDFLQSFFGVAFTVVNATTDIFEDKNTALIRFVAEAEAVNLVNSIQDLNLLDSFQIQVQNWVATVNEKDDSKNMLYQFFEQNSPHYSSFSDQIDGGVNYLLLNGEKVSKDRTNPNFVGFDIVDEQPVLRHEATSASNNESDGEENMVDTFINDVGSQGFFKTLLFDKHGFDTFAKNNIPYIFDEAAQDTKYDSDFIGNNNVFGVVTKDNNLLDRFVQFLGRASSDGRTNVYYDRKVLAYLTDPLITDDCKLFYILINFCGALTYFHQGNNSNSFVSVNTKFAFPAYIEVPFFAHLNMGMYAYFFHNSFAPNLPPETIASIARSKSVYGVTFDRAPFEPYATYISQISLTDATNLLKEAQTYLRDQTPEGFTFIKQSIIDMINQVSPSTDVDSGDREDMYEARLEPDPKLEGGNDFSFILQKLLRRRYLLNYTETTFFPADTTDTTNKVSKKNFVPLKTLNADSSFNKRVNATFFNTFLKKVNKLCEAKRKDVVEQETKFRETTSDPDIRNQIYYSFKAIADKWVNGVDQTGVYGGSGTRLIDQFMFVDRFFNDIGDKVMIDFRPIIEMSQDYDVSVFSVMTRILALNGFEFFPLQNFLSFKDDQWINSFKPYGSSRDLIHNESPAFVCMYIGGTASQLDDPLSDFENDGFRSENDLVNADDFNNNAVRGFKVSFAKQNQTMFKSIDLDTNEHKETNESLAILSEIAQDQSTSSPVPKGQNLYSTYEQRSYSCTVEAMGNMMIQPTEYFILENVPLFNGAYIILGVEHTVVPNNMKTKFMGVKVRSNPNPLVTDFYSAAGLTGGNSDTFNVGSTLSGNPNDSAFPSNAPLSNDLNKIFVKP